MSIAGSGMSWVRTQPAELPATQSAANHRAAALPRQGAAAPRRLAGIPGSLWFTSSLRRATCPACTPAKTARPIRSPHPMRLLLLRILIAFGLAAQFRANEVLTRDSVLLSLIRRAQWLPAYPSQRCLNEHPMESRTYTNPSRSPYQPNSSNRHSDGSRHDMLPCQRN